MKILICNDDGYQAPGIVALYEALKSVADVEVIAPQRNNSAKSNALTLHEPLYVEQASNGFRYVTGTPADCMHLALKGLLDYKPDLVVSGINNGANLGDDTIYSGTVGAAMEAYLFGIPAIAFSQVKKGWEHLDAAALKARDVVAQVMRQIENTSKPNTPFSPCLLNVNIPNLPYADIKPLQVCRLGTRHTSDSVITQTSPFGRTMYWIAGSGPAKDASIGTDFHAIALGHISVTPLETDLSHHAALPQWQHILHS